MALNTERLKQKILSVLEECSQETDNPNASINNFAENLAKAIVEEIKELKIIYISGLTAPNGAVVGTFNATIT